MTQAAAYDVAIIGGGIAGAGAGAMLCGDRRCLLLEAEDQPGHHSTGRSAAVFILNYGNAPIRALTRASESYLVSPPADISEHTLLSPRGHLALAEESGRAQFDALLGESQGLDPVTPERAVARIPILKQDSIFAAAYEADARDIDINSLHQGWLRKFKRSGGEVCTKARVTRLAHKNGIWEIETGAGAFQAETIVNAAGAWADKVAEMAGLAPVGLTPMRRSIAVIPAPEGHDVMAWPLVSDVEERWYMKPDAGHLFVSPADEDPVEPHDVYPDDMVLAEGVHRFETATSVEVTRVLRSWAGLRTFASDRTPVVGFDPAAENFFWLAGQGGYGIQTSPAMAQVAAALIMGQPTSDIVSDETISALSPARFRT
ncbi:NAD(P)/FAD-dependent oxidoreductase [Denitrobaculum tricleocarpae]|uniref:FAD-binding oxidoreductase n=1 Tax=Denitrobaculum tricleocarpae TaxID=2591009 RepID=A0A545SSZ9_9PROT|nr:FAD-binding oxidoreductase [Denitrobaculum tricleocarpae]TQV68065.1 FAD-binding oxidoreductase [Denitrobaculum tricleocarpae]